MAAARRLGGARRSRPCRAAGCPARDGGADRGLRGSLDPADVANGEAEALADRRAPADAALAAAVADAAGVEPKPGDLHVYVRLVGVDRHVLALAACAPVRERAAHHRIAEDAGPDQRVADAARAVVAGVEQAAVAAAPLVGLPDDLVGGPDDRPHARRRALRDRGQAVAADHRGLARDGRRLRYRQLRNRRPRVVVTLGRRLVPGGRGLLRLALVRVPAASTTPVLWLGIGLIPRLIVRVVSVPMVVGGGGGSEGERGDDGYEKQAMANRHCLFIRQFSQSLKSQSLLGKQPRWASS